MTNENYLFFADGDGNDADKDAVMFPASRCTGLVSTLNNKVEFFFKGRDGAVDVGDGIECTITSNNQKAVMEEFCSLASSNRVNTNNFTVVVDLNTNLPSNEGAISAAGIADVSAATITTH
tara:strand:- start:740 stop:1102 length:363 start_codon:yes stop_codon:yes gene_type:complete